jgi:hypothetical protein
VTVAVTGSKVFRSGGDPVPDSSTATTGLPAITPTYETTPGRTERTTVPGDAARSTPRCPAAHRTGGGSKRRSTSANVPPVGNGRTNCPPAAHPR